MSGPSSREIAVVIRARVMTAARTGEIPETLGASERWAVARLRELRDAGEEAGCRVAWYENGRKRHFVVHVRRADGSLEPAPKGPAETLVLDGPDPNVSAVTAAEEKRKRKAEKLAAIADKGAIKRAP